MEDPTIRIGLLMETAQAQQAAAESALQRLDAHVQGLDEVVREQIRASLQESAGDLVTALRGATQALERLKRAAGLRQLLLQIASAALAVALPLGLTHLLLPDAREIEGLRAEAARLEGQLTLLERAGARAQLRECGSGRVCVRIDPGAPAFGPRGEYRVVAAR